jgi:hypothetical protein
MWWKGDKLGKTDGAGFSARNLDTLVESVGCVHASNIDRTQAHAQAEMKPRYRAIVFKKKKWTRRLGGSGEATPQRNDQSDVMVVTRADCEQYGNIRQLASVHIDKLRELWNGQIPAIEQLTTYRGLNLHPAYLQSTATDMRSKLLGQIRLDESGNFEEIMFYLLGMLGRSDRSGVLAQINKCFVCLDYLLNVQLHDHKI